MKTAAIYARVSTTDQTTTNQLHALREVAERMGWEVAEVYEDKGISGAKGRGERPAFDAMLKDAARRKFDVLMAWSVDRLGRNLRHLVECLSELHGSKVDVYLHQQAVNTTTPAGRALFGMMGVFAEFERALIAERVRAAQQKARAEGRHIGRPRVAEDIEQAIREKRAQGLGMRRIARQLGCGVSVVQRVVSEVQ